MKGKTLGKMGLECVRKMGLGCGEEVKQREISENLRQHFFFCWEKPINVATNMEVGEDNLDTKRKRVSRGCTKPYYFPH